MPKTKKSKTNYERAARARAGKAAKRNPPVEISTDSEDEAPGAAESLSEGFVDPVVIVVDAEDDECLCGKWNGTVEYIASDSESDEDWWESGSDFTDESDLEREWEGLDQVHEGVDEEMDADEILQNLREQCSLLELENEVEELLKPTPYEDITAKKPEKTWANAEQNRGFGYTGRAPRTVRDHSKKARDKEKRDVVTRNSDQAANFRSFFTVEPRASSSTVTAAQGTLPQPPVIEITSDTENEAEYNLPDDVGAHVCTGYLSDESAIEISDWEDEEGEGSEGELEKEGNEVPVVLEPRQEEESHASTSRTRRRAPDANYGIRPIPPPKRRRLDIPAREEKRQRSEKIRRDRAKALIEIEKLLSSKKDHFDAGRNGLQAKRARAIQICLKLVVKDHRRLIDASERAAESTGFSKVWGARQVREWVGVWIATRSLPKSRRGCHGKVYSLLDDPEVCTELRSFLRSEKWSMNPKKLAEFTKGKLLPGEAKKYLQQVVSVEMPRGLKKYLEVELFPRVHMKVAKGISLRTAQRWLRKEGFRYTAHKKALYYDGHEREDVVDDRQGRFLPAMEELKPCLVQYKPDDVTKEVELHLNPGQRKIVVVAHDEMTAQAHDGKSMSWVWRGEQPLRKKGPGRGLHQSDVICSTVGWLREASVTMEYGKNYDGYWTGEMFADQLETKIIPAFVRAHGPEYQAAFLIDNSQGHSAYAKDALLTARMNFNPGGNQPHMRAGWYVKDGERVSQEMSFPGDHPAHPAQPKGMKQILVERGLFRSGLIMQCRNSKNPDGSAKKCPHDATNCCAKRILDRQPDFLAQKPLVQEIIERAGHICIFLPKFHCELNFIEYFWGAVKRYLRERCDYTFDGLKENMQPALASVPVTLIRKWENRTKRWMEAYRKGLGAHEAQLEVKQFSSVKYASHRRAPTLD